MRSRENEENRKDLAREQAIINKKREEKQEKFLREQIIEIITERSLTIEERWQRYEEEQINERMHPTEVKKLTAKQLGIKRHRQEFRDGLEKIIERKIDLPPKIDSKFLPPQSIPQESIPRKESTVKENTEHRKKKQKKTFLKKNLKENQRLQKKAKNNKSKKQPEPIID